MIIPFVASFIYFFAKAYKAKENYWLFGVLCGLASGMLTMFLTWIFKIAIIREGGLGMDRQTGTVFGVILILISIWVVDKYSGLKWKSESGIKQNEESSDSPTLTAEELEKLRAYNVKRGIDHTDEVK